MIEFLVVYEDEWHNKESIQTTAEVRIGDAIQEFANNYDLDISTLDLDKYNSDDPYDIGTFGAGFYDVEIIDEHDDYRGRFMIFQIEVGVR